MREEKKLMSNLTIRAGLVAAAAAAAAAAVGGSVSAAPVVPSVCTLFLAESTIPNAGLGVFTTMPYKKGDYLHNAPQDILIPVSGHGEDDIGMLVDYYWETTNSKHHRLTFPEGPFASDFIPGYGACPNSDAALENVEHVTRNAHSDRPSRPHVGVDAYTPYHHVQINAVKDIPGDGAEIFVDYGSSYFETREGIYKEVPLYDDYKEAERIIKLFVQEHKQQQREDEELIQHLWEVVVNATASIRVQKALPSHVKDLITTEDSNFEKGETETKFSLLDPYRDVEVLKQTGYCLNMVEIKKSTIVEAGRGIFAKTLIEQDTVILPVPVMQMKLTKLEQLKPPSGLLDGSPIPSINLIINYCFGDATKSSIILCPYVAPALLVNHSSQKPNAMIRRTENGNEPPYYSKPDLYELPIRFMKKTPLGVMFELVALRPIDEGEEIFIDYGPEWEQGWNTYKDEWKRLIDIPASEKTVDTLLDCVIDYGTDLPHHESLIPSCIADNAHRWLGEVPGKPVKTMNAGEEKDTMTNTACYYYLPRSKQQQRTKTNDSNDKASPAMVLPWGFDSFYEDGTSTLGGLFPCRILAQQKPNQNSNTCSSSNNPQQSDEDDSTSTCNNNNYYTAWIAVDVFDDRNRATIRHPQMVLVKNIPQSHIRYVTQEWLDLPSIDRRLQKKKQDSENDNTPLPSTNPQPKPFRHLIGLPDGVFPTAWMDRLSK